MSDPYVCPWCDVRFVVPSLATAHATTCTARPATTEDQ